MKPFHEALRDIDIQQITAALESLSRPCYESHLMRRAFPDLQIHQASPLQLYQHHFLLFHVLYRLQEQYLEQNKYLHIHFMRIFLLDYPEPGHCRYYLEDLGQFCQTTTADQMHYCPFHQRQMDGKHLDTVSEKYFYLDTHNYNALDEETSAAFLNGTWQMLAHHREFEKSFKVLDLPKTANLKMIQNKFRKLAKLHHPDTGTGSGEKFNEINRAYRFLMRIIPLMPPINGFGSSEPPPEK